jgi:hypothetical protein
LEDKKEDIVQNNEESIETQAEDTKPAAENVVDDDIQYTFVVPKGEIYRDPDLEPPVPEETEEAETFAEEAEEECCCGECCEEANVELNNEEE